MVKNFKRLLAALGRISIEFWFALALSVFLTMVSLIAFSIMACLGIRGAGATFLAAAIIALSILVIMKLRCYKCEK